jgi:hypothetical protein
VTGKCDPKTLKGSNKNKSTNKTSPKANSNKNKTSPKANNKPLPQLNYQIKVD